VREPTQRQRRRRIIIEGKTVELTCTILYLRPEPTGEWAVHFLTRDGDGEDIEEIRHEHVFNRIIAEVEIDSELELALDDAEEELRRAGLGQRIRRRLRRNRSGGV